MVNLSIIITGQIRTFFNNEDFTNMLKLSLSTYENILIICVVNTRPDQECCHLLKEYFNKFELLEVVIIDYRDYKKEYEDMVNLKLNNAEFIKIKNHFFSLDNVRHTTFNGSITTTLIQFHQITIGIKKLIEYKEKNNINFDITMKTRFDIRYPENFCPILPSNDDIFDRISFNKINKELLMNEMKNNNLYTIEDLILFNKNNKILNDYRITAKNHNILSFGSEFLYNYNSLEKINNGNNDIIYSFNVFFDISKTETYIKLKDLFNKAYLHSPINPELWYRFYATETEMINYCLNNNINILVYWNNSFTLNR